MSYNEDQEPCDSNDGILFGTPLVLGQDADANAGDFTIVPCRTNATVDAITPVAASSNDNVEKLEFEDESIPAGVEDTEIEKSNDNFGKLVFEDESIPAEVEDTEIKNSNDNFGEMEFEDEIRPAGVEDTESDSTSNDNFGELVFEDESRSAGVEDTEIGLFFACDYHDRIDPPSDAIKIDLVYDYELRRSSEFAGSASRLLSNLEGAMLKDLAEKTGLLACQTRRAAKRSRAFRHARRRLLQNENGSIVGLASKPKDESIANVYECQIEVELDEAAICTPFRGHMTMWLSPDASKLKSEEQILSLIRNSMENDTHTSDAIKKLSYIGPRDSKGAGIAANVSNKPGEQVLKSVDDPPILAIGLSVFFAAIVIVALVAFTLRRNNKKNDEKREQQPSEPTPTERMEQDDVELLPIDGKLDMEKLSVSTASDSEGGNSGGWDEN